jgi:hypothetical protein
MASYIGRRKFLATLGGAAARGAGIRQPRAAANGLNEHRFRSLGKLIVGNLDRIADVDNVGN